jgi:3-deoxy-manno-octulosonate cytidylyltransferase (CMP-KDO synthetase)
MAKALNYSVVIPARYESSRLPGKPLVDLCGSPMIEHVWLRCCQAVEDVSQVVIATDDERIRSVAEGFGARVIMTSSACLTGTDRVAEANRTLNSDFVINVQGDEPLLDPTSISQVAEAYVTSGGAIINAMCPILDETEFRSHTVPKVVAGNDGKLLYMSRSPIPLTKSGEFVTARKQVCIYAFGREHLEFFASIKRKSPLEKIEDIEILRFLEHGYEVQMIEVEGGSIAVDVPEDVDRVVALMNANR